MKGIVIKTGLVFGLVMVLLSTNIAPGLLGHSRDSFEQKSVDALFIPTTEKTSVFSLNVFGTTGLKKQDVALSADDATLIFDKLKELKSEMTQHPYSEKTQSLKIAFVDLLDEKGLIPQGVSKEAYLSLLNPRWVERLQKTGNTASLPQPFANRGTCALCSMGGEGSGILIPLFLLPRPRIAMLWLGTGLSTAANLLTSKGYVAEGAQTGFAFGFMGIGISYALPGYTLYGFIGYALLTSTTAEYVEHYPPNRAPIISDILPADGEQNALVSLSELQFRIQDPDGDLMSYSVTTEPDIGSGSGNLKPFGLYTVPISGLAIDKIYRWTVEVTDGKETTTATYGFFTEGKPPFDPFTQGWNYRKKITIDHNQVTGDLTNFPLLISVTDQDLRDKAQNDGDDILFMDNLGVATKLYHEIEYFDGSTGILTAWMNIPIVHSTEDTSLYMYYGNSSSSNQQFPEKVWINHFNAVWHLNNNPMGNIIDSSSKDNDGTAQGDMTSSDLINGKIGPCLQFDGADDYISFSEFTNSLDTGTCIAWIQTTANEIGAVWGEAKTTTDKPYLVCGKYYNDNLWFARDVYGTSSNYQGFKPNGMNDGQWHQAAWLSKGTDNGNTFYFDGQPVSLNWQDGQNPNGMWFDDQSTDTNSIGALDRPTSRSHWSGLLDEIRIANIPLSAAWIATEYANQNNPAGFLNIGPEVPGP
ncbi:MAG: DUF2341 domain-containing protein [Thermoplasmata archaeon]|nr:DUF2341 domain-containing protein [Thermoplasmata archaeon]